MGYMHIEHLYRSVEIMQFKECYALEKIHGTSAHIAWKDGQIRFFAGGGKHDAFITLFDEENLNKVWKEQFDVDMIIYGESYGDKCQGMSATYGKEPKFVAFDVKIDGIWLDVPNAEDVANKFGLDFVSYVKISTDLKSLNAERDRQSMQALKNGIKEIKKREGVVLRPLTEMTKSNGKRIIVKHKGAEFMETKTPREVDPNKLRILKEAMAISDEWVTPNRLEHVLDHLGNPNEIEKTGEVIKAMIEDIIREAEGEIVDSKVARNAIAKHTSKLYKAKISKL